MYVIKTYAQKKKKKDSDIRRPWRGEVGRGRALQER